MASLESTTDRVASKTYTVFIALTAQGPKAWDLEGQVPEGWGSRVWVG